MNLIPLTDNRGVLMINVFVVPPENQAALVDAIRSDGQESIPGLLSRHILRSADGTHVTHCMHWVSEDAFTQATATNAGIAQIRSRVQELGARPAAYEVISVGH